MWYVDYSINDFRESPPPFWINHICSELSKASLVIKDKTLVSFFPLCNEQALSFRFIKFLNSKVHMGKNLEVREGEAGFAFCQDCISTKHSELHFFRLPLSSCLKVKRPLGL